MKILLTFFVLFFSPSLFAKEILIDCGLGLSLKINPKTNQILAKNKFTDYKWSEDFFDYKIVTINETELVIGSDAGWQNFDKTIFYNRMVIRAKAGYSGPLNNFHYYNSADFNIKILDEAVNCTYKR